MRVDDAGSAGLTSAADNRRILVVEDDDAIRRLIASVLTRERMEVIEETRSDEAIAMLESQPFGGVVLDLMILPGGGRAVLAWMERNQPHLIERTVVVSAAAPREIESATNGRACRCLPKPFDIRELASLVRVCVR